MFCLIVRTIFLFNLECRPPCIRSATGLILFRKRKIKLFQIRPEVINFAYVWKIGCPTKTSYFPSQDVSKEGVVVEKFSPRKELWTWRFMLR